VNAKPNTMIWKDYEDKYIQLKRKVKLLKKKNIRKED